MANENRDVLVADRNVMEQFGADWKHEGFREEYFVQLDTWHKCQVGPMQLWMLWPLVMKYQRTVPQPQPQPESKPKKTPQLIK